MKRLICLPLLNEGVKSGAWLAMTAIGGSPDIASIRNWAVAACRLLDAPQLGRNVCLGLLADWPLFKAGGPKKGWH
ncbi:hypothetical protein SPAN111604_15110 [Sphingomonas antarctica]|uniref:hypothetical protein n=1 Tax=Sphingomonas antarctica TaxID=2040274 RepID=UPI0039E8F4A1